MYLRSRASLLALLIAAQPGIVWGNPEWGVVVGGQASIHGGPGRLEVRQASQRTVIDWRKFDIAPNETTRFIQPNANAWAINRVNDVNPSNIQGNIQANGHVA